MPCPRCAWNGYDPSVGACERCGYVPGEVAVDPEIPSALDAAAREELAEWFAIESVVASDPHSVLYGALDVALRKRVLLRAIALEPLARAGLTETLRDAVTAAATLNHPHIHPVLGTGTTAHVAWVSMPAVRGVPLTTVLARRGPMGLDECQRTVEQVASALYHAHRRGVIHGAVHPANILVDDEGWALLSGVGVGRVLVALALLSPEPAARASVEPLAPEDHAGLRPTPALDQFGLAVTAVACLGGVAAIAPGESGAARPLLEHLARHRPESAPLPAPAVAALERALRPVPDERFRTILEFTAALGEPEALPSRPLAPPPAAPFDGEQEVVFVEERARRPLFGLVARVLVVVAVAGAGIYRLMNAESGPPVLPAAVVIAPRTADSTAAPNVPDASLRRAWDSLMVASAGGDVAPTAADSATADTAGAGDDSAAIAPDDAAEPETAAPRPQNARATAPARRQTTPRGAAAPPRREVARREPPRPAEPPPQAPGRLFVSSRPWGQLYLDGRLVGNTPAANVPLTAGTHRIRIVREGFRPYEQDITVGAGEHLRLVDLVLVRNTP